MSQNASLDLARTPSFSRLPLRKQFLTLMVILISLYLPFSWILWIDYPWNSYRWHWLQLISVLPGLIPAVYIFRPLGYGALIGMGIQTLLIMTGLTWLGGRSRWQLLIAAVIAFVTSSVQSYAAYGLFWF